MKVIQVPLRMIQPNPEQPRKTFAPEELEELAASIREYGVLQPLLVKRGADRSCRRTTLPRGRSGGSCEGAGHLERAGEQGVGFDLSGRKLAA